MRLKKPYSDFLSKQRIYPFKDALCQQLSIAAIPKVEHWLEEGFDASTLELDESLYANLVLQQIDKPYINEMKNNVLQQQAHAKQLLDVYFQQPVTKKNRTE